METKAKILIIGANGYIGENFANYAQDEFQINTVNSHKEWKWTDFSGYTSILFAAGIAHRKETEENKHLYYEVNHYLALDVAKKAKAANVPQFIYLSTMSVFGDANTEIAITDTPSPINNYGRSKFEAEESLADLASDDFNIAIIRPPMVYGKNCPGKFQELVKLSKYMPIVPDTKNLRSMIFIDNLSEFLCTIIRENAHGTFHPQNSMHINTACLIELIRQEAGKKTFKSQLLGVLAKTLFPICPPLKNAFGSIYYTRKEEAYQKISLESSVKRSI